MTFEEAIQKQYGLKLPITPEDVKMRKFRIDQFRNGFLMRLPRCGVFGSFIDGETFIWNESGVRFQAQEHRSSKEIHFEWLIWHAAKAVVEKGDRLSRED